MPKNNEIQNRLENEKSPYLLQHAGNPVDWYPWGDEAFAKAAAQDKPVFLSIGYSACHWCHVMAHESFEDEETAKILNERFVSVKVDREERPDVDSVYMDACHVFTGSGGWPLSVFLDCCKRPFFAGTYFPNFRFKELLLDISELWRTERDKLAEQARRTVDAVKKEKTPTHVSLGHAQEKALKYLAENFDTDFGGFGKAPKFPAPHNLLFLLKRYEYSGDAASLAMCEKTLRSMRAGGIYDHVGGGFSRYSTDKFWLAPHFEKMLYDNVLLLLTYAECFRATKNAFFADTAKAVAGYLLRDMRGEEGGFFAAEDADSEGREGLFYTFTHAEIIEILGAGAPLFCDYYNITERGNFEGRNILNTIGKSFDEKHKPFINDCFKKLFVYRSKRVRPARDEKIMCGLNGLAVAAFARAGAVLGDSALTNAAVQTADFIDKRLTCADGGLISYYLNGAGGQKGFADDYAFYIFGLLELYEATKSPFYLDRGQKLQTVFTAHFYDAASGGFYLSDDRAEMVIKRPKELYDGAVPSYNSAALGNLFKLYTITGDVDYLKTLAQTLKYFSGEIASFPAGCTYTLSVIEDINQNLPNIKLCLCNTCYPPAKNIDELIDLLLSH